MSFSSLPFEIITHILEYDGRIKYRNGTYINQISSNDDRYEILKQISPPFFYKNSTYNSYGYVGYSAFCIEKWKYPSATDHPIIITNFEDEVTEYVYIHDHICYKWVFYKSPPKQDMVLFLEEIFRYFGAFLSNFTLLKN